MKVFKSEKREKFRLESAAYKGYPVLRLETGSIKPSKRGDEMNGLQEAFTAGMMLAFFTWGVCKIVVKNLMKEWNQ